MQDNNQIISLFQDEPGVDAFYTQREATLPYPVIQGHQVHGSRVAIVDRPGMTREELEGYDAFVTNLPGVAIGVRTADCVPVLLYDPVERVVAAVHAGWKGTVLHISEGVLEAMGQEYGSRPANLLAVIGPSIGPDSFQVGEEVAEKFKEALWEANRWLLEQLGIPPASIQVLGIDTYTTPSLFSARREGVSCGRIINSIRLK